MKVFEIKLKVYLLADIPYQTMLKEEAHLIDSVLMQDNYWSEYHKNQEYKYYSLAGLYPVERDGMYKKDKIYTIMIRTVNLELANYLSVNLKNHYTDKIKGLTLEMRIIPKKMIQEIYSLTPVILKTEHGYWKNTTSLEEFERCLFENIVKKYNHFTQKKVDEDFQLYTSLTFLNKKAIGNEYKGITLLGDKVSLKIADHEMAQEIAYFATAVGLLEMNSRGFGFCNYLWT